MEQIIFRPKLYKFDDTKSFAEAFHLGKHDLVLTNRYIFDPYFDGNPYGAQGPYGTQAVGCSCCDMCMAMACMDMCCSCGRGGC